jgi:hypothetical protein
MADLTIRLHYRDKAGKVEDAQNDFGLESFGGQMPAVGDLILDPGVLSCLDRRDRKNRRKWTVVQRVFTASIRDRCPCGATN